MRELRFTEAELGRLSETRQRSDALVDIAITFRWNGLTRRKRSPANPRGS